VFDVPVEGRAGLEAFHRALAALHTDPSRQVRVLHYGDSNVAADLYTQVARERLQREFGDGGSGYLLPRGHGSWHRVPAQVVASGPWGSRRRAFVGDTGPSDGLWGLAGTAMEPTGPGAQLVVRVPSAPSRRVVELHLLGRPRPGGVLAVSVDGGAEERVSTHRDTPGLIVRRWSVPAGVEHRVRIRHVGGRPRVLGVAVDAPSGVVYDVLGINGARASGVNHWNLDLWRQQIQARRPDLVVMSYGGNEALDPNLSMQAYETTTREAIQRVRTLAPGASCLLVGPVASMPRYAERMSRVAVIQRRLAADFGCAFWDASLTAGGPGTLRRWLRFPGMVGGDRLHLGPEGYGHVGREFVDALLGR
jgi:lysophospholipase L1-like esterase